MCSSGLCFYWCVTEQLRPLPVSAGVQLRHLPDSLCWRVCLWPLPVLAGGCVATSIASAWSWRSHGRECVYALLPTCTLPSLRAAIAARYTGDCDVAAQRTMMYLRGGLCCSRMEVCAACPWTHHSPDDREVRARRQQRAHPGHTMGSRARRRHGMAARLRACVRACVRVCVCACVMLYTRKFVPFCKVRDETCA